MIKQLVDRIRVTRRQPAHEFVPEGWERAERERSIQGWNVESVVAAQAARLPELERTLASTSPLGCASSRRQFSRGDVTEHNTLATFAYVAALAAGGGPEFSLLDWGGGVGQYGKIAQAVLPDIRVDYYCKEVPVQCRHGRRYFPEATFFERDEQLADRTFDLVLASGAVQYVQHWRTAIERLVAATRRYLFVTRLPVVLQCPSYVLLQRAYQYGYDTEYLGWCLNRDEFVDATAQLGVELVREFIIGETARVAGAPEPYHTRGFLFRPK